MDWLSAGYYRYTLLYLKDKHAHPTARAELLLLEIRNRERLTNLTSPASKNGEARPTVQHILWIIRSRPKQRLRYTSARTNIPYTHPSLPEGIVTGVTEEM